MPAPPICLSRPTSTAPSSARWAPAATGWSGPDHPSRVGSKADSIREDASWRRVRLAVRGLSANFPIAFGRYQLVELLAVGGMAELFLADVKGDHGFAKKVVIKRILPQLAADPHFTAMFIAEAKITARLAHPKIAQTHRLGREDGQLYIEMEYVDGLDVLAMLRECAHRRVRLPAEVSVYIIKEVLDGLDFAHRLRDDGGHALDIVHRDISPSNVLVSRRGNVKLVDFGIAQAAANEQTTKAGTLKGKYGYMSPEQVMGTGLSSQSDLFSVGVVLAEMLMGRRLFAAPNELDVLLMVRDVNLSRLERYGSHVPADLDGLLRRALQKDPSERYATASEMRDALDEWLFQSRLRMSAGRIGELVESLYEDASQRRRQGLEEVGIIDLSAMAPAMAVAGEVGVAAASDTIRVASPHESEIDGIPVGHSMVLGGSDSLEEAEIELAMPVAGQRADAGHRPAARRHPSAVSTAPPGQEDREEDLVLSEEIDIDLSGLELAGQGTPPRGGAERARRPGPTWGGISAPVRAESSLPRDTDEVIPISIEDRDSVRFPTISAAVASVSPARRDPASRDFDGT
ncbi:MAG TPA: serine/threonine-protein kinase, partial [Kofleriaceae bacterium]|nr:serine/threonine-protein kinase [Kofleriaceae bacterium]